MRSLRVQLLAAAAAGMAVVLCIAGVLLYALIGGALRSEFDQSLAAKARALAALVELDEDGLDSELRTAAGVEFGATAAPEYYQVWLPDGRTFARCTSLAAGNLERIGGSDATPRYRNVSLPDGRPGRSVEIAFTPRREEEATSAALPPTLTLVAARGTAGLDATLAQVRFLLIGVGLGAVALSAAGLAWVVHRQLRPLARLGAQIAAVDERDLNTRFSDAGVPAELAPVVQRLNELLTRLEAAFERERRFTGDVAHELRTPLAGLRAMLETALSRPRAADDYRSVLDKCLGVGGQMQRMVETLLHLARADAGQLPVHREPVDVAALARQCWKPLAGRAAERRITAEWVGRNGRVTHVDRSAVQHIVGNLLENAAAYAPEGDTVHISCGHDGGLLTVAVRNRTSMPPGDVAHVFERFWRADPARPLDDGLHCGLGLPLCRALVRQLGGSIDADVSASGVFSVVVRIPDAADRPS